MAKSRFSRQKERWWRLGGNDCSTWSEEGLFCKNAPARTSEKAYGSPIFDLTSLIELRIGSRSFIPIQIWFFLLIFIPEGCVSGTEQKCTFYIKTLYKRDILQKLLPFSFPYHLSREVSVRPPADSAAAPSAQSRLLKAWKLVWFYIGLHWCPRWSSRPAASFPPRPEPEASPDREALRAHVSYSQLRVYDTRAEQRR